MTLLERITGRTGLAILAILGAMILWVFVINDGFRAGFLDKELDVQVNNLETGLALSQDPEHIAIQVKAPQSLWMEFPEDELAAFIDLEGLDVGTHRVPVEVTVKNPRIIVLELEPEEISVSIEYKTEIEKEISFEISGEAAEGFVTKDIGSEITSARISGSSSALARVSRILATATLQGEEDDIRQLIPLVAVDANNSPVQGVSIDPGSIEVDVPIDEEETFKTVHVEGRTSGSVPEGYELRGVSVTPSTVELEGTSDILDTIDTIGTQVIALDNIRETLHRGVELDLPEGITIRNGTSVSIQIEIAEQQATRSLVVPVETKDIKNGLRVKSVSPSSVTITVAGSKLGVDGLGTNNIKAILSLTGKDAGTYDLAIQSGNIQQLPAGITVQSVDTPNVQVILEK